LSRFSFLKLNQLHKRTGFVFLALACVSILIAYILTLLASFQFDAIAKNGMISVAIANTGNNIGVLGSGVNLDTNPTTNLLEDSSFEPNVFREVFTVEDGNKNTMIVSNKQARPGVYGDGFFVGADVRVTTTDATGIVLRKSGKISRYSPNQISEFQKSPTIGDIPANAKLNDYTTKDHVTITVGDKGTIIMGINTQSPTMQYEDTSSDFTSVTHNESTFFACASDGLVISSADGKTWIPWETPAGIELNAIAASSTAVVAVGKNGTILTGAGGVLYLKEIGLHENITDITYGNNLFVAVTDNGSILTSSNGLIWTKKSPSSAVSYVKIEYTDTLFALLTQSKEVQIFSDIQSAPTIATNPSAGIIDVTIMSKSKILYLGDNAKIYQSDNQGRTWEESKISLPKNADLIGAVGDEEILCASIITNSYIARLVTEIEVDSDLRQGAYQAGDLCYLDIEYATLPQTFLDPALSKTMQSRWEFYGDGDAEKVIAEGAPDDGVGIIKLSSYATSSSIQPYAVLSQAITTNGAEGQLKPSTFYSFSMWVRQENITDGIVKVWISGPFDSIGMEFPNIGTTWKKVTFKFLVPPEITAQEAAQARINIGTQDQGVFYFDRAALSLTSENEEAVPIDYKDQLKKIAPTWTRLNFLKLGAKNEMPDRWAENGELEEALHLVLDGGTGSNPWIVIDSFMGESELRNLIEYIAGSISTPYGKIRMENGSSLLWSSQFNKILIEFVDTNNHFTSDVSRAVYVNEMIEIIESSPYYNNIKNEVVFVDGMKYVEGLMLSGADHSALDFQCKTAEDRYGSIRQALNEYNTQIPRNADSPTNLPINLMRSVTFKNAEFNPTTAEITTILLDQLGVEVNASMVSLQPWSTANWSKAIASAAMIASKASKGELLPVTKTQMGTNESQVDCYAFKDGKLLSLVFASHNTNPVAIAVDTAYSLQNASLIRIDSDGGIVEESTLKTADKRLNIMPENVILLQFTIE